MATATPAGFKWIGTDKDGRCQTGRTISAPSNFVRLLFRQGFRSLRVFDSTNTLVAEICDIEGKRVWWGDSWNAFGIRRYWQEVG